MHTCTHIIDEKVKHDPDGFRKEVLKVLEETKGDFENAGKALDAAGSSLDFRRYAEVLFDVLIAGGILAPGGEITEPFCAFSVFQFEDKRELIQMFAQMFEKLLRRYKYLEVSLEEEICKLIKFLKTFSVENRSKLAKFTAALLSLNLISAKVLSSLTSDTLVREGHSLEFITIFFREWLVTVPMGSITPILRKEKIDLLEFMPQARRTTENFRQHCVDAGGLDALVQWQAQQHTKDQSRQFQKQLTDRLSVETPIAQVVEFATDFVKTNNLPESDVVERIFTAVMDSGEWSKKAEVETAALRHLKLHFPLLQPFLTTDPIQLALIVRVQNFCFDNSACTKMFHKFVLLMYKEDLITEDAVFAWNNGGASPKGRTMFLEQMTDMIEWLKNAEEESDED